MYKLNTFFLLILSTCVSALLAQPAGNSLLWKISGNGLAEPSYILGTMHVFDMDAWMLSEETDSLISATDATFLEINLADTMAIYSSITQLLLPPGETISNYLTEDEYKKLDSFLMESVGVALAAFDNTKPIFIMSLVYLGGGSAGEDNSVDLYILDEAERNGKKIGGLETFSEQLAIFDSIPYADQVGFIMEALTDAGEEFNTMDVLTQAYRSNDLTQLSKLILADDPMLTKYGDILLHNRNKNWVQKMQQDMQGGSNFYGVGAGHLPGPQGVLQLLSDAGYTLTPILPKQ